MIVMFYCTVSVQIGRRNPLDKFIFTISFCMDPLDHILFIIASSGFSYFSPLYLYAVYRTLQAMTLLDFNPQLHKF